MHQPGFLLIIEMFVDKGSFWLSDRVPIGFHKSLTSEFWVIPTPYIITQLQSSVVHASQDPKRYVNLTVQDFRLVKALFDVY
jgi:hypothetical protein